ncbi:hypothetical protein BKA70DRAFT_1454236 [Coprinopsis sp. MPI-PUGE-AT-0042]|nr:hypothetical protein BKA70DRAFT_1454236 [Coprinopsis sp. MPI-PUGE-AT-0042]
MLSKGNQEDGDRGKDNKQNEYLLKLKKDIERWWNPSIGTNREDSKDDKKETAQNSSLPCILRPSNLY